MSSRVAAVLTFGYAVLADLIIAAGLPPAVAAVCVAPLVLFAPGYACVLAWEIPEDARLPGRRGVIAVALRMGSVALGGLLLNALGPLDEASWTEWLVGVTCAFAIAALARDLYEGRRWSASAFPSRLSWPRGLSPLAIACVIVAIIAVTGGAMLTESSAHSEYDK